MIDNAPLEGIRVLSLARIPAGPSAGHVLADMGAAVLAEIPVIRTPIRFPMPTSARANRRQVWAAIPGRGDC